MLSGCDEETFVTSDPAERTFSDMASIKMATHRLRELLDNVRVHLSGHELAADDRNVR
jgi:hypothetical protein